jgi:hypothetical protein
MRSGALTVAAASIWSLDDAARAAAAARPELDRVTFGDRGSERSHHVTSELSTPLVVALGQRARTLDPTEPVGVWGGRIRFLMVVDPGRTTYFSLKLWGEDFGPIEEEWRLQLFVDGKAVGWFDQGPVDSLDQASVQPRTAGQFYLHTIPIPETLTAGRSELELEVRALGRIWSYDDESSFYKDMTGPSRPVYAGYTHVEPYFLPSGDDEFGTPRPRGRRPDDSEEAGQLVRERVLEDQPSLLHATPPTSIDPWGWMTLVHGYQWSDGPSYREPRVLQKICEAIDAAYVAWQKDDSVLTGSGQQWLGFGRVALALDTLWRDIGPLLDGQVTVASTVVPPNPGFEFGTAGWTTSTWRGSGDVVGDSSVAHAGESSLRLTAHPNGTDGSVVGVTLTGSNRPLVGQGTYRVSAWCKTQDVAAPGACLDVLFYDDEGSVVRGDQKFFAGTGTHDWEQVAAEVATPAGASRIRVDLRVDGVGTAWFDDVVLKHLDGGPPTSGDLPARRVAYRDMLVASREYWRQNQRHYTNQVQFTSLGVYLCNKGLELLSPEDAWPEERAREWIYEAVGLLPLTGGEFADGTKKWKLGRDYYLYTEKGVSRELGHVGGYGEITGDLLVGMYEAVTAGAIARADEALRGQIEKLFTARGWFRHEGVDADGHRVMRFETVIGWRNEHYAGEAVYFTPTDKDVTPLQASAAFPTPTLVGWSQEMIADGQLGPLLALFLSDRSSRIGLTAARFIMHDLPPFAAAAPSEEVLPGGRGAAGLPVHGRDERRGGRQARRRAAVRLALLARPARRQPLGAHTPRRARYRTERDRAVRRRVRIGHAGRNVHHPGLGVLGPHDQRQRRPRHPPGWLRPSRAHDPPGLRRRGAPDRSHPTRHGPRSGCDRDRRRGGRLRACALLPALLRRLPHRDEHHGRPDLPVPVSGYRHGHRLCDREANGPAASSVRRPRGDRRPVRSGLASVSPQGFSPPTMPTATKPVSARHSPICLTPMESS